MRHVFILNPAAGKHHRALDLVPRIKAYFAAHPADYLLHETTAPGEATAFVRQCCAEGVPTRFYACGGDGTLIETAAGLRGCAHAELTAIPCGSANDYIRSFGDEEAFHDLPRLIGGTVREVDGIRCVVCSEPYSAEMSRRHNDANMLAFGARVVGVELAKMIVRTWLTTPFEGGRHQRRVDMLSALERGEALE